MNALIAVHPKPTVVLKNAENPITEQAVPAGNACELSILEAGDTAVISADPSDSFRILVQRTDIVSTKPIGRSERNEAITFKSGESGHGANPDRMVAGL